MDDADWSPRSLAEARTRIDAFDSAMLDLLHDRARVVAHVGRLKREAGGAGAASAFRPAREIAMLRSLAARTHSPLSFETVHAVWREIVSGFTAAQMPLCVASTGKTAALARDVFGAQAEVSVHADPADCLALLKTVPGAVALVPAEGADWSRIAASGGQVAAAAPFVGPSIEAWCVTTAAPEESGEDVTLIASAVELDDFPALGTCDDGHVIAVAGFHPRADAALAERLGADVSALTILGAYPVPLQTGQARP